MLYYAPCYCTILLFYHFRIICSVCRLLHKYFSTEHYAPDKVPCEPGLMLSWFHSDELWAVLQKFSAPDCIFIGPSGYNTVYNLSIRLLFTSRRDIKFYILFCICLPSSSETLRSFCTLLYLFVSLCAYRRSVSKLQPFIGIWKCTLVLIKLIK